MKYLRFSILLLILLSFFVIDTSPSFGKRLYIRYQSSSNWDVPQCDSGHNLLGMWNEYCGDGCAKVWALCGEDITRTEFNTPAQSYVDRDVTKEDPCDSAYINVGYTETKHKVGGWFNVKWNFCKSNTIIWDAMVGKDLSCTEGYSLEESWTTATGNYNLCAKYCVCSGGVCCSNNCNYDHYGKSCKSNSGICKKGKCLNYDNNQEACEYNQSSWKLPNGPCCGDDNADCGLLIDDDSYLCTMNTDMSNPNWYNATNNIGDVVFNGCDNYEYSAASDNKWYRCDSSLVGTIGNIDGVYGSHEYICTKDGGIGSWKECFGETAPYTSSVDNQAQTGDSLNIPTAATTGYKLVDYWPLVPGNYWKYDDGSGSWVEGYDRDSYEKETIKYRSTTSINSEYSTNYVYNDENGLGVYGGEDQAGDWKDYKPKLMIADRVITLPSETTLITKMCPHEGSCNGLGDIKIHIKWENGGTVTTPKGTFHNTLHLIIDWGTPNQPYSFTNEHWLAKNIGIVKHKTTWYNENGDPINSIEGKLKESNVVVSDVDEDETIYYCTSDAKWERDLDNTNKQTCESAKDIDGNELYYKWVGDDSNGFCCGDDSDDAGKISEDKQFICDYKSDESDNNKKWRVYNANTNIGKIQKIFFTGQDAVAYKNGTIGNWFICNLASLGNILNIQEHDYICSEYYRNTTITECCGDDINNCNSKTDFGDSRQTGEWLTYGINPSFEHSLENDYFWIPVEHERSSDKKKDQNYALKLSSLGASITSTGIKLNPGTTYILRGDIYNNLSSGNAYLDLNDKEFECQAMSVTGIKRWQHVLCRFKVPEDVSSPDVHIRAVVDGDVEGEAYFDNIGINTYYCTENYKFTTDLDINSNYKTACEKAGYNWTGDYCCGEDDDIYGGYKGSDFIGEYYNSHDGSSKSVCGGIEAFGPGLVRANKVSNNEVVNKLLNHTNINELLVYNGTVYGCAMNTTINTDILESYYGGPDVGDDLARTSPHPDTGFRQTSYSEDIGFNGTGPFNGTFNSSMYKDILFVRDFLLGLRDYPDKLGNSSFLSDRGAWITQSNYCTNLDFNNNEVADAQDYFCSYKEIWKPLSSDEYEANSYRTHLSFTRWDVNVSNSETKAECCAPEQCWDGKKCVNSTHETSLSAVNPDSVHPPYRCIKGGWYETGEKYKWDKGKGYCENNNQCLVNPEGLYYRNGHPELFDYSNINAENGERNPHDPQCINDTQYIGDHYCDNGTWSSRTRFIAVQLLSLIPNNEINYTLYCDSYDNIANYMDYEVDGIDVKEYFKKTADKCKKETDGNVADVPCINNICVLKYIDSNEEEKIVIGTSLNHDINATSLSILKIFSKDKDNCNDALKEIDNQFEKCSDSIWYHDGLELIIFDYNDDISITTIDFWQAFINFIKNPFSAIFDYIIGKTSSSYIPGYAFINQTKDFNKIYLAKKGQKEVKAVFERTYGASNKFLTVNYRGFDSDICGSINQYKNSHSGGEINCTRSNNDYYIITRSPTRFEIWKDLTAKLRIT
jgi:hypothetical protein